ncbi:hypothetical protein DM860_010396 [Cuscuta australis]|uniref:Protein kinase domain-containing protein n=1 Tax=Cuscuta australis TaxID=267555 RepID=A0A328E4R2_9ASTE|nr:hypothetical protein DM860_010396 [Cuscuta australis]
MKHPFPFLLLFLIFCSAVSPAAAGNDTAVLSLFRSQTDPHGTLLANWTLAATGDTACSAKWVGVNCTSGRVTALSLPSLSLRGPIDALSSLDQLRRLDLRDNRLNGTIAPVAQCLNLKALYLSRNDFSGVIPEEISSLRRLLRLDLSSNNLKGPIPTGISNLTRLRTLRLQNNEFSGNIPDSLGFLRDLNVLNLSNNEFQGILPQSLYSRFGRESFAGNERLCGSPLPQCSFSGETPPNPSASPTIPSNPSSLPDNSTSPGENPRKGMSRATIVAIAVANAVVLLVAASFVVAFYCGKKSRGPYSISGSEGGKRRSSYSGEKRVYAGAASDSDGTTATDRSRLVFFNRRKQFELEELLRASAELLGKGSLGTVYKAVLDDGRPVAVKRLKDANPCGRKEFEQYMDVIGRLNHPNIVKLRAYYYAKEEKLLVYDYLPNGTLHSLLHDRGAGRVPLDWTTRLGLVLGVARGLSHIHQEFEESRIPHGNLKSSNILLDKNGTACISDFGLSLLLNPAHAVARLGGYKAPEQAEMKRLSQKADVYSFGVLLLEVLTGRKVPSPGDPAFDLPKWARSVVRDEWTAEVFDEELLRYKNIEEELVSVLHIALACVIQQPEKRPTMGEVVRVIEEMRLVGEEEGYRESRDSISPSLVATTEDGIP